MECMTGMIICAVFKQLHLHPNGQLRPERLQDEELSQTFYSIIDDCCKESTGIPIDNLFETIRTIKDKTADQIPSHLQQEQLNSLLEMADQIMQTRNLLRFYGLDFSELGNLPEEIEAELRKRESEIKKFLMRELMMIYNKLCFAHKFHIGELPFPV